MEWKNILNLKNAKLYAFQQLLRIKWLTFRYNLKENALNEVNFFCIYLKSCKG